MGPQPRAERSQDICCICRADICCIKSQDIHCISREHTRHLNGSGDTFGAPPKVWWMRFTCLVSLLLLQQMSWLWIHQMSYMRTQQMSCLQPKLPQVDLSNNKNLWAPIPGCLRHVFSGKVAAPKLWTYCPGHVFSRPSHKGRRLSAVHHVIATAIIAKQIRGQGR